MQLVYKLFVLNSITCMINNDAMKIGLIALSFMWTIQLAYAQSDVEVPVRDQFDEVTMDWLSTSSTLSTYAGITSYCRNPEFRASVDQLLVTIHHYDSLLLDKLEEDNIVIAVHKREQKKAQHDIQELEEAYSMRAFHRIMKDACAFRYEIEKNKELLDGVGFDSYDGKVLVLEADVSRYLKKIDKLMVRLDENIHVLELE